MSHIRLFLSSWVYFTGALFIGDVVFRFVLPPADSFERPWWSPMAGGAFVALVERFFSKSRSGFGGKKDAV